MFGYDDETVEHIFPALEAMRESIFGESGSSMVVFKVH